MTIAPSAKRPLPDSHSSFPGIVGRSPALRGVLRQVRTAAKADFPVLIEGESGTGKELIAMAVHRLSSRAGRPFVSENCGALPGNLVESECFGHERGAFTGATSRSLGLFERADGGSVFLDEIGEMDVSAQRILLRVLQDKQLRRIGGQQLVPVDFRVISATNRSLEQMVECGSFRKDLFYRINVATITVPPLRDRVEDIPLLVDHFRSTAAGDGTPSPAEFTRPVLEKFCGYSWPGNIRELRNEILRLLSLGLRRVDVGHLSFRIRKPSGIPAYWETDRGIRQRTLDEVERDALGGAILSAIRNSGGNIAEAARRLGITRSALYRRLERYDLVGFLRRIARHGSE